MKDLIYGMAAGLLIGIGGTVYLSAENRVVGAVLFAVALICICAKGYSLYTGKVGYIAVSHKKKELCDLLFCFIGNLIGTFIAGICVRLSQPALSEKAFSLCTAKIEQPLASALIRAVFCGILMYLAVSIYRERNTYIGILFCVPVFILSGFEHSIANLYYFFTAGYVSFRMVCYLLLVVFGNSVGGMLLPFLSLCVDRVEQKEKSHE